MVSLDLQIIKFNNNFECLIIGGIVLQMIVILNFGSQFAHLIARRVREVGVRSEILPYNATIKQIKKLNPSGIILSGGPNSVNDPHAHKANKQIYNLGIPILGICYGQQLMVRQLGGAVKRAKAHEYGKESISISKKDTLFKKCKTRETVWFSHSDNVVKLPKGFRQLASTSNSRNAAIEHRQKHFYGVQFHPEVTHTVHGKQIISNFVLNICKAPKDWQISSLRDTIIKGLKEQIGKDEHVLIGLSGGVDSLVTATLLRKAVGDRAHAVLIDTGLLRKNEAQNVKIELQKIGIDWLNIHNSSAIFFKKLKNITNPEKKRKIIGHTFISEFEKHAKKRLSHYNIVYLAQGTIYPDRIESAEPSKNISKIKSHHNLTLPEKMRLKIVEPIKDLYKDEVRKLGISLGLPKDILNRHPFPGPGLAIRILGSVNKRRVKTLQEADAIYMQELKMAGEYNKIWQAFAALLPVKCVGVMGDARTYENIVTLRAVDSVDAMTADWHNIPNNLLAKISSRIVSEVRGINRVVYDITQKPPGTIEYE